MLSSWSMTEVIDNLGKLQLNLKNATLVSENQGNIELSILFLKAESFTSLDGERALPLFLSIDTLMPAQLSQGKFQLLIIFLE